jgi:hypothetical protein
MRYKEITWWDKAFHVYKGDARVGIVNCHTANVKGRVKEVWYAHNKHFFSVGHSYPTRAAAASVLDTKPIRHKSNEAFK